MLNHLSGAVKASPTLRQRLKSPCTVWSSPVGDISERRRSGESGAGRREALILDELGVVSATSAPAGGADDPT